MAMNGTRCVVLREWSLSFYHHGYYVVSMYAHLLTSYRLSEIMDTLSLYPNLFYKDQ